MLQQLQQTAQNMNTIYVHNLRGKKVFFLQKINYFPRKPHFSLQLFIHYYFLFSKCRRFRTKPLCWAQYAKYFNHFIFTLMRIRTSNVMSMFSPTVLIYAWYIFLKIEKKNLKKLHSTGIQIEANQHRKQASYLLTYHLMGRLHQNKQKP